MFETTSKEKNHFPSRENKTRGTAETAAAGPAFFRPFAASGFVDGHLLNARLSGGGGRAVNEESPRIFARNIGAEDTGGEGCHAHAGVAQLHAEPYGARPGAAGRLISGMEALTGIDLGDVRVQYNSPEPAKFGARAYTRRNRVYLGPGREGSLGHELGHAVQQKRSMVGPTAWYGGVPVNDDPALETGAGSLAREAEFLAAGLFSSGFPAGSPAPMPSPARADAPVQMDKPEAKPLLPSLHGEEERQWAAYADLTAVFTRLLHDLPGTEGNAAAFAVQLADTVEDNLPGMLHAAPFSSGLAAIAFAREVITQCIRQDREIFTRENALAVIDDHLKRVVVSLVPGEEKKPDVKTPDAQVLGKDDPRYKLALARVGRGDVRTEGETDRAKTRMDALVETDAVKIADAFERKYGTDEKDRIFTLVSEMEFKILFDKYRFLLLVYHRDAYAGRGALFIKELNECFSHIDKYRVRSRERETLADRFFSLGILPDNGGEKWGGEWDAKERFASGVCEEVGEKAPSPLAEKYTRLSRIENNRKRYMQDAVKKDSDLKQSRQDEDRQSARELAERLQDNPFWSELPKQNGNGYDRAIHGLHETVASVMSGQLDGDALLLRYEDFFARKKWVPGHARRKTLAMLLEEHGLLPSVDWEFLAYGAKSMHSIYTQAERQGWITKEEIEIAGKLLGQYAFARIVNSHMVRKKPAPLRAMVEQIVAHRDIVRGMAPPLKSTSLILDTNAVEILLSPGGPLAGENGKARECLVDIIFNSGVTDIRLANMNVAELSGFGKLIGTTVTVEKERSGISGSPETVRLPVLGMPYNASRGTGRYRSVFAELEARAVGERKGDADRSMMADVYLAQREKEAAPFFVTADKGIFAKLPGGGDPFFSGHGVGKIQARLLKCDAGQDAAQDASGNRPDDEAAEAVAETPSPDAYGAYAKIYLYKVHGNCTVLDIITWVREIPGAVLYVVGGAVRDILRGGEPNDIDMKTNVPVDRLVELLKKKNIPVAVTPAIRLVKAGAPESTVDIVSTAMSGEVSGPIDLAVDAASRDFTLNSLFLELRGGEANEISLTGREEDAREGLLRFSADSGGSAEDRAAAIMRGLEEKPENFGRALKFLERGYRQTDTGHPSYHLEAWVLDLLRENAERILEPLCSGESAPARKGLFIHNAGFKTPMEMVQVMRRLQFPARAIRMVYPDSLAGWYGEEDAAYSREVFPRSRSTESFDRWDPFAAPMVKVDTQTGRIYQYRVYARTEPDGGRLLVDVDYTDHGRPGHRSPHFHVYLWDTAMNQWNKKDTGFSRTGQPGEPPLAMGKAGRVYTGPQPWSWARAAEDESGGAPEKQLEAMAEKAGLSLCWDEYGTTVDIAKQITLPLQRVRQLAENGRLIRLLQLVRNIQDEIPWNPEDDTVIELTGSGVEQERLRFAPQLHLAGQFLLKSGTDVGKKSRDFVTGLLKKGGLDRVFDLVRAGYAEDESAAASAYAWENMAAESTGTDFVNYFEYFIAARRNGISVDKLAETYQASEKAAVAHMAGAPADADSGGTEEERVRGAAGLLHFIDTGTAVYHLHKHLDMVGEPEAALGNLKHAAREYIALARDTVAGGTLEKTVHETADSVKLYFTRDDNLAIVELDTRNNSAHLLTCYARNKETPLYIFTRNVPAPSLVPPST